MALVNWRIRENSRNVVGVTAGIIEGIELTGMATQSSISVRGSSEQKVPSVRKGGRGGGGNRNSGGGPGHSGHSVLSSVSSSSILHLSVLKTTWKINARLILLTELLIGTWEKLYLLPKAAPPLVIYSSSFPLACRSSFQLARHRSFFSLFFSPPSPSCSRVERFPRNPGNRVTLDVPPVYPWNAVQNACTENNLRALRGNLVIRWNSDRTYVNRTFF